MGDQRKEGQLREGKIPDGMCTCVGGGGGGGRRMDSEYIDIYRAREGHFKICWVEMEEINMYRDDVRGFPKSDIEIERSGRPGNKRKSGKSRDEVNTGMPLILTKINYNSGLAVILST